MQEILKKFKSESSFTRNSTVIISGSIDDEKSYVKVSLPNLDMDVCNTLRNTPHSLQMKNDVYETATVDVELKCRLEIKNDSEDIIKPSFEYCCESYDEYLSSEINSVNNDTLSTVIYEDNNVTIHSDTMDESSRKISWRCVFKDASIHSIRELTDVKYMSDLKNTIQSLLEKYEVSQENLCSYFNYSGKTSSTCLKIVSISTGLHLINSTGNFIYFDTFLKNIMIDPEYYHGDMFYIKKVPEIIPS